MARCSSSFILPLLLHCLSFLFPIFTHSPLLFFYPLIFFLTPLSSPVTAVHSMKLCELCNGEATIYCSSDSALLCSNCDAKVHAANFLVARHLRSIICSNCTLAITTSTFSGHKYNNQYYLPHFCNSCSDQDSSDCISSTDNDQSSSSKHNSSSSSYNKNINNEVSSKYIVGRSSVADWKAEAVLVNWANKLGIGNRNVVEVAYHAFGMCDTKLTGGVVPYRLGLAASLWFSLRLWDQRESEKLKKRVEEICGVPFKLIVAAHSKLVRTKKIHKRLPLHLQQQQEEGWAEC